MSLPPRGLGPLRAAVEASLRAALTMLAPAALVRRALPSLPPKRARVRVIAAGKASARMAEGALAQWGDRIDDLLIATSAAPLEPLARAHFVISGHPLPDAESVLAAEEALLRASELGPTDVLLALISGGASALLAAPPAGMALELKRRAIAAMLDAGAPIEDVNLCRRHLSRVKGGRLARAARGARVLTLFLNDVVGGAAHDVGSGPTVLDPTSIEDARAALRRWIPREAPALEPWLNESVKSGPRTRAIELANPLTLARAVAAELEARGLRAEIDAPDRTDAAATTRLRLARAESLAPGHAAVIACEPTVALPRARGRGGRAGRVALEAVGGLPEDVILACAASDGVDGSSGHAGAIVWRAALAAEAAAHALASYDDASAHEAMGTSLDLGATGHNLTDVHVLARLASPGGPRAAPRRDLETSLRKAEGGGLGPLAAPSKSSNRAGA